MRIPLAGGSAERREAAAAEAFAAGAVGAEEHDGPSPGLSLYAAAEASETVVAALEPFHDLAIGPPEPVPDEAWPETWKEGLVAVLVSPRLLVRPSFVEAPPDFAGAELVVDPGQAFGTGAHASTRLALEALAALPPACLRGARLLDVGCGSGVLGLAALVLGAARAVGCDLDPLATAAARENARANALAHRLGLFTGSLDALGEGCFDGVAANLLRRELEPLLESLARHVRPGGHLILSGLLASEGGALERRLVALGFAPGVTRGRTDPDGERWIALTARRGPEDTS